jgi:CRP-like cAMP-binding protein
MGCGTSRALPVEELSTRSASSPPSTAKAAAAPVRPDWPGNQDAGAPQGSVLLELSPSRRLSSSKTAAGSFSADAIVAAALKQKRKAGVVIFGQSSAQDGPPTKPAPRVAKSAEINALIRQALKDNVFFSELGEAEIMAIVDAMAPRNVSQGEIIIKQGDPGDNFYVIQSGYFEIVVNSIKVVEWGDNSKNKSFGELALLYNLPRAATVRAMSEAKLWYIDRTTFRHLMAEASHAQHARLREALRKGIFEDLAESQLDSIAAAATIVKYNKGDRIIAKVCIRTI